MKTEAVAQTETQAGNSEYYTCSTCGKYFKLEGNEYIEIEEGSWIIPANFVAGGTCGDSVTWVLYGDGTLIISGSGPMESYEKNSDSPWYNNYRDSIKTVTIEYGVTSIGDIAFSGLTHCTSVTIPNSVTSIGYGAFPGCYITSIDIPDSVTSIGDYAFLWCAYLTSVTLPDSITDIG